MQQTAELAQQTIEMAQQSCNLPQQSVKSIFLHIDFSYSDQNVIEF
ncbi:hypothetical protein [Viridibacillus arvi]